MIVCYVPNLRFLEFDDQWKRVKLKNISQRVVRKNKNLETKLPLTISAQYGLIDQSEFFNKQIASKDLSGYYLLKNGEFAYNKSYSNDYPFGAIKRLDRYESGALSSLYICFQLNDNVNSDFISHYFETNKWHKEISDISGEGARNHGLLNMSVEDFFDTKHWLPSITEQSNIAEFLTLINARIETQSKIIEDLIQLRKYIIDKQFSQYSASTLGDFVEQTSYRNNGLSDNVLSVSNKRGFIQQTEQFEDRIIASNDISNYKVVYKNDFAYNPARINVGSIARLNTFEIGIVSPMYVCFCCNNQISPEYLNYYFMSSKFKLEIHKRLEGSVRQCLQYEGLCNVKIFVPNVQQQNTFVLKLNLISKKIELEKSILEKYKEQKKFLLSNMFI